MSKQQKRLHIRILVFCLALACLFFAIFPQTAAADPAPGTITLTIRQEFTKPVASGAPGEFRYELTASEPGNPMPSGNTGGVYRFSMNNTDSITLGPISFTQAGRYHYEIRQTADSPKPGYSYDDNVYIITVDITPSLESTVVIKNAENLKVSFLTFQNRYAPRESLPAAMLDLPIKKTVSGLPEKDSEFAFKLEAMDKSNPMPSGSTDGKKTVTITGGGETSFGTWSYREAKTYYYTVSEINTGEAGYTYDTALYTITDCVEDVDGQLTLNRVVTNGSNKQVTAFSFINQYAPASGSGENSPQTGDTASIELYVILLCIGTAVFLSSLAYLLAGKRTRARGKHEKAQ